MNMMNKLMKNSLQHQSQQKVFMDMQSSGNAMHAIFC